MSDEKQLELQLQLEINDNSDADQEQEITQQQTVDASKPNINNADIDKKALWSVLQKTQCPLMPCKYEGSAGKLTPAYYFNDEFWIDDDDNPKQCRILKFPDGDKGKAKRKAKDEAELILAVDDYLKEVRINKAYEIYAKLQGALMEKQGFDDGDDSNDAYMKLVPTMVGRIMFLSVFLTTTLNGYFLGSSLVLAMQGSYNTPFMNYAALVMAICELVLYTNILFGRILSYGLSMIIALCRGGATYKQGKIIAQELRNLSTLSILRYMPSVELVSSWAIHWRQSIAHVWTDFYLLFTNSLKRDGNRNVCDIIFTPFCYIVETVAPVLAVYAILVKMKQLGFVVEGEPFADWGYLEYIAFAAFLNQVAGLRVLRNVETQSIQHFVFSGCDAELDKDELLLLDDWWNVTVLSAVSNLNLGFYDNMVFWYSLDPQKIQLLLKFHSATADSDSLRQKIKDNDDILEDYDRKVVVLLNSEIEP